MSKIRYKVEYECDCGMDWGSCGRTNMYLFEYNCSCDIGTLIHQGHINEPNSTPFYMGAMTDNNIKALIEILTNKEGIPEMNRWEDKDYERLKEARGW